MAKYSTTQVLSFGDSEDTRALIVDGNVTVEVKSGSDWVQVDTLTTGSYPYFTKRLALRFTPTSGSTFEIHED